MYPPSIADQLRRRGHDVESAQADPELRDLDDRRLFEIAQTGERALLTENVADYAPLDAEYRAANKPHHGLVYTSDARFPRGAAGTIGALVKALDAFLKERPASTANSAVHWLGRRRA